MLHRLGTVTGMKDAQPLKTDNLVAEKLETMTRALVAVKSAARQCQGGVGSTTVNWSLQQVWDDPCVVPPALEGWGWGRGGGGQHNGSVSCMYCLCSTR